jgi:hypothetical protein
MHDCQRFLEDWIAGVAEDVGACESCRAFCEDTRLILQAIEGAAPPVPELPEAYWNRFDNRLRDGLLDRNRWSAYKFYFKWSAATGAAAALAMVVSWGALRPSEPVKGTAKAAPQIEFVDDHIKELNPTVVNFLGRSELFLRSFTKIDPDVEEEDLEDARSRASQDLAEIARQKSRAADFAPVRMALDEYENFLREIKHVDSAPDIAEIQTRIRRSGLIANMKANQPHMVVVAGD